MIRRRDVRIKRPGLPRIDWTNPLTKGLICAFFLNECAGGPYDPVSGLQLLPSNANAVWGTAGPYGRTLRTNTAGGAAFYGNLPASLKVQPPVTYVWSGSFLGTPDNSSCTFGSGYDAAGTPPYGMWGLLIDSSKRIGCYYGVNAGSNNVLFSTVVATNRGPTWVACTHRNGANALYIDNPSAAVATDTVGISTWVYTATSDMGFGAQLSIATRNAATVNDYGLFWNRVLTPKELIEVRYRPGQLLRPRALSLGYAAEAAAAIWPPRPGVWSAEFQPPLMD